MMHALTIIVIVNNYCCCDFVGFKEFREEGRIREHINDKPFFFLNNLNQTTSEKSSFLASLSTAPTLFTIIFQTFAAK